MAVTHEKSRGSYSRDVARLPTRRHVAVTHETSRGGYSREVAVLVEPERLQDESDDGHDGLDQTELQRRLRRQPTPAYSNAINNRVAGCLR